MIDKSRLVGMDLETPQRTNSAWGLQPWRATTNNATIKTIIAVGDTMKFIKAVPSKHDLKDFLSQVIDEDLTITGWNLKFDFAWFCAYGLYRELKQCKVLDAMLLSKRYDPWARKDKGGIGFGLKAHVEKQFPERAGYQNEVEVTSAPRTKAEWVSMLRYNFRDSKNSLDLCKFYVDALSREEIAAALDESAIIADVARSYINGITINVEALDKLETLTKSEIAQCTMHLGIDPSVVSSPKKLAALIYDEWGYPCTSTTLAGNRSTNAETLLNLALANPEDARFSQLTTLRKARTRQSKFIKAVRKSIEYNEAPITRPAPIISGTITGRFTYASAQGTGKARVQTGVALHQWERKPEVRRILSAPDGYLMAEFDWAGQEMRLMAILSEDPVLLDAFLTGKDGHAIMGAAIEGCDYEWVRDNAGTDQAAKAIRQLGKFANLSLQYRIGVATLRSRALTEHDMVLTSRKAQHIRNTYLRTYKQVPEYWKKAVRKASVDGFIETMGHRRIPTRYPVVYEVEQNAINYPIQGTGGDMKILGVKTVKKYFGDKFQYAWDLHDALFTFIKDDTHALARVKDIREILSTLPYKKAWGWDPIVPLPVDAKLGKTWGDLKDVD